MRYYISWTHSDLVYQQYLHDISVLVSPPNVNLAWQVLDWPVMPQHLIIDSGAFQYHREKRTIGAGEVLERQLRMLEGSRVPAAICHLDLPMLGSRNALELERRVVRSLENAAWLMDYVERSGLPDRVEPIGVIQAYEPRRVYEVAQALANMGYARFGVGSLAGIAAHAREELLRRVEAALEAVGTNLHVLGVSSSKLLPDLAALGVESADSGAPIREAWTGGVYYSRPFRRYKIKSQHSIEWSRNYGFSELLEEPLPCDCPVCQDDPEIIMRQDGKRYVNLRALHNCYHLMRQFREEEGVGEVPLSAERPSD